MTRVSSGKNFKTLPTTKRNPPPQLTVTIIFLTYSTLYGKFEQAAPSQSLPKPSPLPLRTIHEEEEDLKKNKANTINLAKLFNKLLDMNIDPCICHWIHIFFCNRQQTVKINNNTSSPLFLSTGAPQGCILSPWLFSLYTNQLTSLHSSVYLYLKYVDDSTIVEIITNNQETD